MMRGDEAFLRERAIKLARWAKLEDPAPKDGVANCVPVQLPVPTRCKHGRIPLMCFECAKEEEAAYDAWRDAHPLPGDSLYKAVAARDRRPATKRAQPYFLLLMGLLRPHGIPEPKCELLFDPVRKWRFDFAWPAQKVALEIDGGLFSEGAHTRGLALIKQMEKQNAAVLAGWRILRYTPQQLTKAADDVRLMFEVLR